MKVGSSEGYWAKGSPSEGCWDEGSPAKGQWGESRRGLRELP